MPRMLTAAIFGCALITAPAWAQKPPDTWDGLHKVDAKRFDVAFMAPGADFRSYTKVMLDPTEAAFRKNWQRDFNRQTMGLENRITDDEAKKALNEVQVGFRDILVRAYMSAGYQVTTEPGPDVLRLRTTVFNIEVAAPDQQTSSRSGSFSRDAGQASLMIEVRDSMSGAVLGRVVDSRTVGDDAVVMRRTQASNRADFKQVFNAWAKKSVEGFAALTAMPPIDDDGKPQTASAPG